MAGNTEAGFAVRISAVDMASATLDKVNKRIAAMNAPAERFNRALAKFGDVSGVSRLSQGMGGLSHNALDAFRSVDRIAAPLAQITGAASIAGMTLLVSRWAELGTQVAQTSYRLNVSPSKLTNLENAARLAGSSAQSLDAGLKGLGDTLSNAAWGRDPAAVRLLNSLNNGKGIAFRDAAGNARQAADAIGDIADAISKLPDARTQARVLNQLGIGEDLLPVLKNGSKGLAELQQKAKAFGGGMTDEMAEHARQAKTAFEGLSEAIEGVSNRLADQASGPLTNWMNRTSDWIAKNQATADSIAKIGASIIALGALKPSAWVMRILGLGALVPEAATVAAAATVLGAGAAAGAMDVPMTDDFGRVIGGWGGRDESSNPAYVGIGGGHVPSLLNKSDQARAASVRDQLARDLGLTPDQASGIASNLFAESGIRGINEVNPAPNTRGGFGWAQWTGSRRTDFEAWAAAHHLDPASDEANRGFLEDELRERYPGILRNVKNAPNAKAAAAAFFPYESGGDPALTRDHLDDHTGNADRIAALPSTSGNVHVQVTLKGAPAGTTAQVTTQGQVTASPPRIETSMVGAR